jgi:O-antigen/teichoic acid export membrane protein
MFAENRRAEFVRLLTRLTLLGVSIGLVGVPVALVAGRPLLTLLYRREYAEHVGLLALLVATAAMSTIGSFLFCGVTAAREFRAQLPVNIGAIFVVFFGSAALIPRWGLIGAGMAVLLSTSVTALGGFWIIRKVLARCKQYACKTI